jgi:HlyD family secretion protein
MSSLDTQPTPSDSPPDSPLDRSTPAESPATSLGPSVEGSADTHQADTHQNVPTSNSRWKKKKRPVWRNAIGILSLLLVIGLVGAFTLRGALGIGTVDQGLLFHTVQRSHLPIVVTERGNLESQQDVQILCETDDIRSQGIRGTLIVWIIPNGSSVKKGDLLVELDDSQHVERLDRQILLTERAKSEHLQAQAAYDNQITQNETAQAEAELQVELAKLELAMFTDQEAGTHRLEVEEIERLIDDTNSEILAAQANLELRSNDKMGIESLFKLGYAGKNELDRSRLDYLQAEGQFAAKMNRLQTQMASLVKKETFERQMQILQLEGNLDTAKRDLVQAVRNNEAMLAQAEAQLNSAVESLKKEEELLARYRDYVEKCKIYAPQDGLVAYASDRRREEIREGAAVRLRQVIMTIPNLEAMQVETSVHESVLDQVFPGQRAKIRVDAFPENLYEGTVQDVAVLPDQGGWMSSDTKVYSTTVTIDEQVSQLKPGMTAVVEIQVDHLRNVLTVPIQAIIQRGKTTWCFVQEGGKIVRRELQLGRTNDKHVEVQQGLQDGDQVVLNPTVLLDEASLPSEEQGEEQQEQQPTESDPLLPEAESLPPV